ncbi:SCA7-domain-containing protein [Punctularia strigosozonata HHB-11173 SS5]|uniref:SCA7-domain-containing protein n=1 Tax=Punctularia strigosozonata (strain HHB-11173) TaxID=741275 RepID=UPI0004417187|nr:SCA7-domain-containing protein [Punctularia strigosozonata HHB-11173 SS5]EIN05951.1 SCA7-domain-containing protein [Punctularia strigosozonata HHB-11173 SS5]
MPALKLRGSPGPSSPFSWDNVPSPPPLSEAEASKLPSPPTSWLAAQDMKTFGAQPLRSEFGLVRCKECGKPVLRSAVTEHASNCKTIRNGGAKKAGIGGEVDDKKGKKRKASDEPPDDPSQPKKKKLVTPKVTKGRFKGPVDLDKQCGVINDKNLPCSRSLTCKSHSMGAKRAVQGRSKDYDVLLLEWNRANNPNWVEPVKKPTKEERKKEKERERAEKKRLALEAAAANAAANDAAAAGEKAKKAGAGGGGSKKKAKAAPVAVTAVNVDEEEENLDDLDSEEELDSLVKSVRAAQQRGLVASPLALPGDASAWFVARRERLRTCRELIAQALMPNLAGVRPGIPRLG